MEGWTKDGREVARAKDVTSATVRHQAAQGWQFTPLATEYRATDARARRPLGGSCLCQHARKAEYAISLHMGRNVTRTKERRREGGALELARRGAEGAGSRMLE
jgi:hypothetical protein